MQRLSIVITNHNYERYVGQAIDSALALDWPDVEVIVVDDASTDDSRTVLDAYGDRIRVLYTQNPTQLDGGNDGFAASTGDVVIFLDADDLLPPELPHALAAAMTPEVTKAQFQMQRIDAAGTPIGVPFPRVKRAPTSAEIRRWLLGTTAYPTPPGSGNAYARWYLDRLLPLGRDAGTFNDSALLATAPLLGEVRWVEGPLVEYRIHDANDSDLLNDPGNFVREVRRALSRWRWALKAAGRPMDDAAVFRSREVLQFRAAAQRLVPGEEGLPGDSRARLVRDALASPLLPGPQTLAHRLGITGWTLLVAVAPLPVVRRVVAARYRRAP